MTSPIDDLADEYIRRYAALNPIAGTSWGIAGSDHRLPDLSPDGLSAIADLQRDARRRLAALTADDDHVRIGAEVMAERLDTSIESHDAGDDLRSLSVLQSAAGSVRQCFDLMPLATDDDWAAALERMRAIPTALVGARATLDLGRSRGLTAARRQAVACAAQCEAWGSSDGGFFSRLVTRATAHRDDLRAAAEAAEAAYRSLGAWLIEDYAPDAITHDPVGPERYARMASLFNGARLELHDTYRWGWEELHRIEGRMRETAQRIVPGATVAEAIAAVERDPRYVIDGVDAFQRWNQDLIDRTIAELDGVHFDIAEPIRRCEAMIAPPGGAAAMYYTGPSEDFSRPGRTCYPTLGKSVFPLWREVSICYHEGVPGHHLQIAQVRYRADVLNRFQRLAGFVSGHGEGWALYAERLMEELGYLDDPVFELGMLSAQAMRAVRVVVDIGMHLELTIPDSDRYHPGERWTPELALPFVIERSCFPADFMASEVDRYLGMPGQAISYKVGERVWLDARAEAQRRHGAAFDLREFHRFALDLGGMGLDQLTRELARF